MLIAAAWISCGRWWFAELMSGGLALDSPSSLSPLRSRFAISVAVRKRPGTDEMLTRWVILHEIKIRHPCSTTIYLPVLLGASSRAYGGIRADTSAWSCVITWGQHAKWMVKRRRIRVDPRQRWATVANISVKIQYSENNFRAPKDAKHDAP